MLKDSSDIEIIEQVLKGNTNAYTYIVNKYKNYVFTIAYRFTKNREDAEDVSQEIFIKIYKHLGSYKGEAKFSTWIYTIITTSCISYLRKKKIPTVVKEVYQFENIVNNVNSSMPILAIERKEKQEQLQLALNLLEEEDKVILTLFYQFDSSINDLAAVLKIEPNNAKVKLHRARLKLKQKIEKHFKKELIA